MKRFRQILVVLTDSAADKSALQWTGVIASAAQTRRIQILVLDQDPADWVPEYPPVKGYEPWKERVHQTAEQISEVLGDLPGLTIHTKTCVGAALPTILHELMDGESDLVVIGVADDTDRSLAEKLARKSPASLLSVPADTPPSCKCLLTPVDFSEPSALALEIAEAFTRVFDSEIRALHVFRLSSRAAPIGVPEETLRAAYRDAASERLQEFLENNATPGIPSEPVLRESAPPSTAVLQELEEHSYDLVVMATRGRSSLARALLGSNTAEIIRRSPVPVLAVKAKGEGLSLLRTLLNAREIPNPETAPAT